MKTKTKARVSQDEQARATRRKILIAATNLFMHKGYGSTTVADLAREIGMTQGAFFHHFPNKEALLHSVVERLARGFDDYTTELVTNKAGNPMRRVFKIMVAHYNRQPEAAICLATLATEFAGSGHPILAQIRQAYDGFVTTLAKELASDPDITNPRAAAIAFVGAAQGIGVQGLLREGDPTLEELGNAYMEIIKN